ncbi:MAG: UDP-4-amino-4-deoxy-L-arabinose--oxoglutarate aminotransferase, partial [Candidatus Dadabacteria bacterium]
LLIRAEEVERAVTEKTRAIIPVHYAGAACDLQALHAVAEKHSVTLIEDAAHAIGTTFGDSRIGSGGTALFSFHPIKNITTGEGGMLCTDDGELAKNVKELRFHGLGVDAFDRKQQGRSAQAEVLQPGYKYNLTDISAALGLEQLKKVNSFNQKRAELAALYLEKLAGIDEIVPLSKPDYDFQHSWHLFIVRLDTKKAGISRDTFMEELKKLNIGTGLHFKAVHTQKYYRETLELQSGVLPNTEWNSERICSLPLFPAMEEEDVLSVVESIKEVLKK